MSLRLPVDLYSPDQLSGAMLELRDYIGNLRDNAARSKAGSKTVQPPQLSPLLANVLHSADIKPEDRTATEAALKALELIRRKAPTIHVTLPAPPNRTLKRQLTVWFRTQVHEHTLLTFAMRADLGGGIVVRAGSHVYDFSFKQQILNNRQRIAEIFASVR